MADRIFYRKESSAPAPAVMERKSETNWSLLPTGPMVYAVISEPSMVDNPDIPSYHLYVHGRCEPPALIPLHMHGVAMEVDCFFDTTFVTLTGTWRLHCVTIPLQMPIPPVMLKQHSTNQFHNIFGTAMLKLCVPRRLMVQLGKLPIGDCLAEDIDVSVWNL